MPNYRLPPEAGATPGISPELVDSAPDQQLLHDPADYSAIGGPEPEAAYGRTRAIEGEYPFNWQGGAYDRDETAHVERGGIATHHRVTKLT